MAKSNRRKGYRSNSHSSGKVAIEVQNEDEVFELIAEKENPLILLIDGVQDPHNLGACIRSACAAGVDIVFAPQKHNVGLTETVRQISCGGADHVPYIQVPNLNRTLNRLKEMGVWLVGTGDAESQLLYEANLTGPLGIVMGSEAFGLRQKIAEKCDFLVRIPMLGEVDCLNLSVATGVCLYEAVRQRMG